MWAISPVVRADKKGRIHERKKTFLLISHSMHQSSFTLCIFVQRSMVDNLKHNNCETPLRLPYQNSNLPAGTLKGYGSALVHHTNLNSFALPQTKKYHSAIIDAKKCFNASFVASCSGTANPRKIWNAINSQHPPNWSQTCFTASVGSVL